MITLAIRYLVEPDVFVPNINFSCAILMKTQKATPLGIKFYSEFIVKKVVSVHLARIGWGKYNYGSKQNQTAGTTGTLNIR